MIERSDKIDQISKALLTAQPVIDIAVKNATGHHGKYADLHSVIEAVKEPLNNVGVLILQAVDIVGERTIVVTSLIHTESEQFFSSNTPVLCQSPNDPQKLGSGITYAKRYGLQALNLVPSDDDDGHSASRKPKDIPPPSKQEATFNEAVATGLLDIAAESGLVPDPKMVGDAIFNLKKCYKSDESEVSTVVGYFAKSANLPRVCLRSNNV